MASLAISSRLPIQNLHGQSGRPSVSPAMPGVSPVGGVRPSIPQRVPLTPSAMSTHRLSVPGVPAEPRPGPVSSLRSEGGYRPTSTPAPAPSHARAYSLSNRSLYTPSPGVEARPSGPAMSVPRTIAADDHQHALMHRSPSMQSDVFEEKKQPQQSAISTMSTVLRADEIADLKRYHDSSLATSTRRAYQSDYDSFVDFLRERFPQLPIEQVQTRCTLEHVLAYLNELCNQQKKIATINRRLSTIKKHILPGLFARAAVPGSRQEQIMREVEAIIKGIRRTVSAEHRIRGKQPLLIENIREMVDAAAEAVDDHGNAMPNKRCRDVALLLFMFHSAMRRNEVARLLWSDLTFDKRGVVVLIRQSKTDKESKGQTIALPRLEGAYCPVEKLEAWRESSGGVGESPVFRWISKKDQIEWRVLIDQRIVALIKDYCEEIGLDPSCFEAHSTRSGYVTSCSERGVGISEMMKRTRHKAVSSLQVYMKSDNLFNSAGDRLL